MSSMRLKNSDFKSGWDVKSGKINIAKACKNLGPEKPGC